MDRVRGKYIRLYMLRNLKLTAAIILPQMAIFPVMGLCAGAEHFDLWMFETIWLLMGCLWLLYGGLWCIRFLKIIARQEKLYNIQFDDRNAQAVNGGRMTYLSDNWLIHAGSCAFCREYIQSMSMRSRHGSCTVTIETADGRRYRFVTMAGSDLEKFRKWRKSASR